MEVGKSGWRVNATREHMGMRGTLVWKERMGQTKECPLMGVKSFERMGLGELWK